MASTIRWEGSCTRFEGPGPDGKYIWEGIGKISGVFRGDLVWEETGHFTGETVGIVDLVNFVIRPSEGEPIEGRMETGSFDVGPDGLGEFSGEFYLDGSSIGRHSGQLLENAEKAVLELPWADR